MTTTHRGIRIDLSNLYALRLPDATYPLRLVGDMRLISHDATVFEWVEQDIHATLDSLQGFSGTAVGDDTYIDVIPTGETQVHLLIWDNDSARPAHVIETDEDSFEAALDQARSQAVAVLVRD